MSQKMNALRRRLTFKPLYGGTSGTPNEVAYYQAFVDKYPALAKWHAVAN